MLHFTGCNQQAGKVHILIPVRTIFAVFAAACPCPPVQTHPLHVSITQHEFHLPFTPGDQKSLAKLYDEYAAVVLGFLEKLSEDKARAEELLQAVFLALPARLHEFDARKGRFTVWLLKLTRTIAGATSTKGSDAVAATTAPQQSESHIIDLLYVKGYTFAQAAAELGVDEHTVQSLARTALKKYRR